MKSQLELAEGVIHLKSEVKFAGVVEITKRGEQLISEFAGEQLVVDCQLLKAVDNSLLTLCLCWARVAKRNKKQIQFINLGDELIKLFHLTGVDDLIKIKA